MNIYTTDLINQIYCPKISSNNFSLEEWVNNKSILYYSFARHALIDALHILGVGSNDQVALPEFICREVADAIKSTGASLLYYPVDDNLCISNSIELLMSAKVIIVVNYFGFPQDLSIFTDVTKITGANIIEDNAHGFLSKDENGVPLGTRASIGIVSIRKSIRSVNGAALILNAGLADKKHIYQSCSIDKNIPFGFFCKIALSHLAPVIGSKYFILLLKLVRYLKIRFKNNISSHEDTSFLNKFPHAKFKDALINVVPEDEISRRLKLYKIIEHEVASMGGKPVFKTLKSGVVPYSFPFRIVGDSSLLIKHLNSVGLDCHLWPELPDDVSKLKRDHYSNLWMVPLLW
jgi:hypothetical protein